MNTDVQSQTLCHKCSSENSKADSVVCKARPLREDMWAETGINRNPILRFEEEVFLAEEKQMQNL